MVSDSIIVPRSGIVSVGVSLMTAYSAIESSPIASLRSRSELQRNPEQSVQVQRLMSTAEFQGARELLDVVPALLVEHRVDVGH
jgi:hypothetical protein